MVHTESTISKKVKILLRLTECKVEHETNELFLIHSFKDDEVCFDSGRLNVVQTEFSPNAAFDMRTFRFIVRVLAIPYCKICSAKSAQL